MKDCDKEGVDEAPSGTENGTSFPAALDVLAAGGEEEGREALECAPHRRSLCEALRDVSRPGNIEKKYSSTFLKSKLISP